MAVSIIDPDNGAPTPDYLSGDAWVTGEAGDQSGAVCRADYRPTSGSADTSSFDITGFSNFAGYVIVQPQSAAYEHDGTKTGVANSAKVVVSAAYSKVIAVTDSDVKVYKMVIENTANVNEQARGVGVELASAEASVDRVVDSCLVISSGAGTPSSDCEGITFRGGTNCYVVNNIVYGPWYVGVLLYDKYHGVGVDNIAYNNTVIGATTNIAFEGGTDPDSRCINNICQDGGTDYDLHTMDSTSGNISEDTSSPQSGLREISLTFAGAGSDDYHLAAGDTDAIGAGTDLDGDAYYAITVDIDGDSRDASTPDIGADEYVAAGADASMPPPRAYRNLNHLLVR